MRGIIDSLWSDECGFVVSSELAMVSTLGVLGLMTGLSQVSTGVNGELHDVAGAFAAMDQSYTVTMPSGQQVRYLDDQPSL